MKRILLLSLLCVLGLAGLRAQIPDGSMAPDFTATDIDGNSHHLYDLLDAGKTVFLDVSATWCGPCWNYHNSHAFKNLWEQYGPDGTDEAYCFYIEGDPSTNTACLYGPSGCIGGTQGDWVTGTPYPIIDDHTIANAYQISYYPTIFCICPDDKKVYEAGQLSAAGLWAFRNSHCAPPPLLYSLASTTDAICFGSYTGSINIDVSGGNNQFSFSWSNGATTQNLSNIQAGTYTVTITSGNQSIVSDPIDVFDPSSPLSAEVIDIQPVGCNGITGSITITGVGGWDYDYSYLWSNGQNAETAYGLNVGTYKATVTDGLGCTTVISQTMSPPVYPVALIATPDEITCLENTVQLDATQSDSGDDFSLQWFATSGGHILSGDNTLTPIVDSAGNYTLQITNNISTCKSYANASVSANIVTPNANAGPSGFVSCPVPLDTLSGSGSNGSNYSYSWSGVNIISGGATLHPVVGAPGVYTLEVTNTANGCTKTSATMVEGLNSDPNISTIPASITCLADSAILSTTTNAVGPTFDWIGPNGFSSQEQSPTVFEAGTYSVLVQDTITGCMGDSSTIVVLDTEAPDVTINASQFTCLMDSAFVMATTPDTNAVFAWTGPNGFKSNASSFVVYETGDYLLVVSDPDNGCTGSIVTTIESNTNPPAASAETPENLNCNASQVELDGSGSAQGANISYNWTTTDGNIVSGADTQNPTVDAVGTYLLLVTDTESGCTATASTELEQNQAVLANITQQSDVLCFGGSTGSATVSGAGGDGDYSYHWNNGADTPELNNVPAGNYLVTLTDGDGCSATTSVAITQPSMLVANASATNQTMNGVNDGTATANPAGGTMPYTYTWSNGEMTQSISNLAPGTYTVSIEDSNGCKTIKSVTVNSFDCTLSADISGTDLTCFGAANGTADVSYSGGTDPITYLWSNGETTAAIAGLVAGIYTVEIVDANNCPASLNIEITEPNQLLANATSTSETSSGANNGTASANPTGGNGNFMYAWSTGETTQNISGLPPGTYTVVVTDQNGCSTSQSVIVNSFTCAISASSIISHVQCADGNNGSVSLNISGGATPLTYEWSNGESTQTISNLVAGTYTAIITDANQCQTETVATVLEPLPLGPWDINVQNPVCAEDETGSAAVSTEGGTMPYNFLWSDGTVGNTIENASVGTYTVQVTDGNGCTSVAQVDIEATDNEAPSVSAQNATLVLSDQGSVMVTLADINALVSDNCGIASISMTPQSFSCQDLGDQVLTLTATDHSGLMSSTTVTVTIVDNTPPVVTCPGDIKVCSYDNMVEFQAPVAEDNCLILSGHWEQSSGLPSGSEFPAGTTLQEFSFTDASGNSSTCSFEITVTDAVLIASSSLNHDLNGQGIGSISIDISGGEAPYSYSWLSNGQQIATTKDINNLMSGTYDVIITDAAGCEYHYGGFVIDNLSAAKEPVWLGGVSLQPNPTSGITDVIFASPVNSRLELSLIDATGRVLKTQITEQATVISIDCSNLPGGVYSLRFRSNHEVGSRKLMVIR